MVFLSKRAGLASLKSSFLGIERAFLAWLIRVWKGDYRTWWYCWDEGPLDSPLADVPQPPMPCRHGLVFFVLRYNIKSVTPLD